ncbi:activator of basal transcription related protein [Cyclospora cayetanensis]|uniref:Activator of basal transcription related protein n=1 Tax=Cyclospora cayetanensis TaxID=88456 RepID=A0A1D3CY89_9EIME|nr:activator of basal transcription related protein [Cyclospora cayetanensis]
MAPLGSEGGVTSPAVTPEPTDAHNAGSLGEATEAPSKELGGELEIKGRGVVYVAQLPHGWTRMQVIRYFEKFGEVTRVFLNRKDTKGNRRGKGFIFTDGWVEYRKKKHAKRVVALMHGQPFGGKKRNKHAQDLLMLSYLKGFDFGSLYEDVMHVKRTRQDRLNAQMTRVKKESQIYMELLEQKHSVEQRQLRLSKTKEKEMAEDSDVHTSAAPFLSSKKPGGVGKSPVMYARKEETKKQQTGLTSNASVSSALLKMLAA